MKIALAGTSICLEEAAFELKMEGFFCSVLDCIGHFSSFRDPSCPAVPGRTEAGMMHMLANSSASARADSVYSRTGKQMFA
jgi:hypothetical protein